MVPWLVAFMNLICGTIMHGSMGYRFYQNSLLAGINFRRIWGFTKIVDIGIYESSGCSQKNTVDIKIIIVILI